MSVAPIVANVFALMPCVPLMLPVALVPSDLTEGNEPATTTEGKESQQGNRNGLALSDLFPESVHGCGMVAVALMVALVGSVMSVALIVTNVLAVVGCLAFL